MPLPNLHSLSRFEAQLLLAHILGRTRAWVISHPGANLSVEEQARLDGALAQLEAGIPLPYVLGHWEFFSLDFTLTPEVLIPRPETELLVETALGWLKEHPEARTAVDVGTGSGCIAVTLAKLVPNLKVIAVDRSAEALSVARQNAQQHEVAERVRFLQADLLSCLDKVNPAIQLLVANLPYIPTRTLHSLPIFGREPTMALDGGIDGMSLIAELLAQAKLHLAPGGLALLEIEAGQGTAVKALAGQAFPEAEVSVKQDLAGLDRLLVIQHGD